MIFFFLFKQKTAYEMRISDSSDVCSSDLLGGQTSQVVLGVLQRAVEAADLEEVAPLRDRQQEAAVEEGAVQAVLAELLGERQQRLHEARLQQALRLRRIVAEDTVARSEEHTSELQSLMRNSYAVFCLKKKTKNSNTHTNTEIA